jgi:hypothetical protein
MPQPQHPAELQLYRVRFGLTTSKSLIDSHVAVEAAGTSTTDEACELAEALRDKINLDTGLSYEIRFLSCIGVVYVWRPGSGPP